MKNKKKENRLIFFSQIEKKKEPESNISNPEKINIVSIRRKKKVGN